MQPASKKRELSAREEKHDEAGRLAAERARTRMAAPSDEDMAKSISLPSSWILKVE